MFRKSDVKSAFRQIWVRLDNVKDFATEVSGKLFQLLDNVMVLFLVLSFDFAGSLGAYQILANAVKQYHLAQAPERPEWPGGKFAAWFFVDDREPEPATHALLYPWQALGNAV